MQTSKLRNMCITAMLTAISVILYFIAEFPIIPGFPHLKLDFSDIPALIAAIIMGPVAGITVELLKNVIHLIRTGTFGIGELANFVVGVSLIVPFSLVFNKLRVKHSYTLAVIVASIVGTISIVVGGLLINLVVYPIFIQLIGSVIESPKVFITYLLSTIPMNLIKAGVVILFIMPLFPILSKLNKKKHSH